MSFKKSILAAAMASALLPTIAIASPTVHAGDTLAIEVANYASVIDDSVGRLRGLQPDSTLVAADGTISIPVIGTVPVAGKNVAQIGDLLEHRLAQYVRDPVVKVRLISQAQSIFLTGSTVGTLPYLPGETLASAIGQLREQSEKDVETALQPADRNSAILARSPIDLRRIVIDRDGRIGKPINGEDLLRSGLPGPTLNPGDTLRLASKPVKVTVQGQVNAPGPTYLYPEDTLEEAVLEAGGPLSTASTADVSLFRDGTETPLPLGGAAIRQAPRNGDRIVVRAAPKVTVLGMVTTPGEIVIKNGSTLLNALYLAGGPNKYANVKDIQVVHAGVTQTVDLRSLQHGDLTNNMPLTDGDVVYVPEGHKIDPTLFFSALAGAYELRGF
jgi:protein involved in polysaccharide export with SLBB domain